MGSLDARRRSMSRGIEFARSRSQRGIVTIDIHTISGRLAIIFAVHAIVNHVLDVHEGWGSIDLSIHRLILSDESRRPAHMMI
jgi:hypothetical protein